MMMPGADSTVASSRLKKLICDSVTSLMKSDQPHPAAIRHTTHAVLVPVSGELPSDAGGGGEKITSICGASSAASFFLSALRASCAGVEMRYDRMACM